MLPTDQYLFHLIAVQNERAFNEIYYKYQPRLFTWVKKMLKQEQYEEDIVQEVFIKLWTAGDLLVTIHNPSGWLRGVTANKALDHLKREKARRQVIQLFGSLPEVVQGDEIINFKELQAILDKAILQLPIDTGVMIRASIEEGMCRRHIAEQLGLSVKMVKNKMEYGRRLLREHLREYAGIYLPWILVATII